MTFTIDHGVEIPPAARPTARLYPFEDMDIGDSFFVPTKDPADRIRRRQSVANAARKYIKERGGDGRRFTTRQLKKGVRCWRIS